MKKPASRDAAALTFYLPGRPRPGSLRGVPVDWVLRDHYPVRENVARADVPIAVIYGSADTIVPAQQSRDVAQAARDVGNYVIEV